jgi:FHA domain
MRRESPVMPEVRIVRPLLVWHPANGTPVEFEIWPEEPLTIGRDATNTVVINSPFVSKAHAIIRYSAGQYSVEDLNSSNGTRVNGAPIATSLIGPGDIVEVGDQRFVFMDGKPAKRPAGTSEGAGGGLSKNAKLALAAIGTLGVLGVLFALILSSATPPDAPATAAAQTAPKTPPAELAAAAPRVDVNSQTVAEVLERAQQAGIKPVDGLYDEANIAFDAGRLREATQLYGAVLQRDPKHESAKRRFEESKARWAQAILDHTSQADRAFDELRLDDAILEWGQVLLLTDATDKRHKAAQDGIDRARQRLGR